MSSSYPRPPKTSAPPSVHPRPITVSLRPPRPLHRPALPCPRSPDDFMPGWTVTSHVFPAAWPRRPSPLAPLDEDSNAFGSRAQRAVHFQRMAKELQRRRNAWDEHILPFESLADDTLWMVANRYTRDRAQPGGITVVAMHAAGMHKETWEPTLRRVFERDGTSIVDELWSIDLVSHGDSALINAGKLPEFADAAEFARDLLVFMLHYLPPKSVKQPPIHLQCVSYDELRTRQAYSYRDRKVVGLAHSVSGTMALSALECPALFDALVLVDPVIVSPLFAERLHRARAPIVFASLQRRREWNSREEAFTSLSKAPFFKAWDAAVLKSFVQFGMTFHPKEGAILKTTPFQEACIYAEGIVQQECWERLATLPPSIELFWIMGGDNALTGGDEGTAHTVWRRPLNSSNVRIPGASHLVVQQEPSKLADFIHAFLERKYRRDARAKL